MGEVLQSLSIADEGFDTDGLSVTVAEVARLSVGGTSTKQDNGALLRISQTLSGLVGTLVNSLEEFRDVEKTLELGTPAGIVNGSSDEPQSTVSIEARPELLLAVGGTLKKLVETLMSDIKANAEVQKLLPAIQKAGVTNHHAIFQDLMIHKQPSCSGNIAPPNEETTLCISSKDSRMAKRAAGKGQMICKHFCQHHPEVVDSGLWRKLPQELVEIVFAKLPSPRIIELRKCSKAWYAISKSSNFGEACSESNPNLFGLSEWYVEGGAIWTSFHDIKSKEWLFFQLAGFPPSVSSGYEESYDFTTSLYACDEGLVCFVPQEHLTSFPILVCNPLTSNWKTLPLTPVEDFENKEIIIVQLVMEDDTKLYRVILVSREKSGEAFSTIPKLVYGALWTLASFMELLGNWMNMVMVSHMFLIAQQRPCLISDNVLLLQVSMPWPTQWPRIACLCSMNQT